MRLTLAGERLLARSKALLDGLREAEDEVRAGQDAIEGQLQISMPSDLGRHVVLPWLNDFQARYPGIKLRLQLTDRLANIYREPVDIALRFGVQPESSMVALPLLAENRRVLCASPAYLARHGMPASPRELESHNCLCFMLDETVNDRWRFRKGNEEIEVAVQGDRLADDSEVVRRWSLAGIGICYRSRIDVHADLAGGRLRLILPEWEGVNAPLTMLVASRKQLSPAVRVLREFLVGRCRALTGA
jgi:DNA-binding transcriptional LysR family regulator